MAVVLITGCSSGFGLEAAVAFARRGGDGVRHDAQPGQGRPAQEAGSRRWRRDRPQALDVTDDASVTAGIAAVVDRHGPIDVLNNAGVGYGGAVETIPLEAAQALMDTNFWGAVRTARAVLPSMRGDAPG